jgi:hypothetical protein
MTRPKTPAQKIGEWQMVYRAVLDEMLESVPGEFQRMTGIPSQPTEIPLTGNSALTLVRDQGMQIIEGYVIADRRTAAIVAAMLVGQNVRLPVEELEP